MLKLKERLKLDHFRLILTAAAKSKSLIHPLMLSGSEKKFLETPRKGHSLPLVLTLIITNPCKLVPKIKDQKCTNCKREGATHCIAPND